MQTDSVFFPCHDLQTGLNLPATGQRNSTLIQNGGRWGLQKHITTGLKFIVMVKKLKISMKFTVKNQEKAFTGFNRPYDGFGSQIYQVGKTSQITKGERTRC